MTHPQLKIDMFCESSKYDDPGSDPSMGDAFHSVSCFAVLLPSISVLVSFHAACGQASHLYLHQGRAVNIPPIHVHYAQPMNGCEWSLTKNKVYAVHGQCIRVWPH